MKTTSGETALELQWVCPKCKHRVGYIPIIPVPLDAVVHPWKYLCCPVCEKTEQKNEEQTTQPLQPIIDEASKVLTVGKIYKLETHVIYPDWSKPFGTTFTEMVPKYPGGLESVGKPIALETK